MHDHGGGYARVVNMNAGYPMLKHKPSPCGKDVLRFREKSSQRLKPVYVAGCLLWRKSKAVCVRRARGDVPELHQVLREAEELLPPVDKALSRRGER